MAVTAKAKINEMIKMGKADMSVRDQYAELEEKYKEGKANYKFYKNDYESKEEQLKAYKTILKNTPWSQRSEIRRKIKRTKAEMSISETKYENAKETYKQSLKELRKLKNTIRKQYKNYKMFEKLFSKLDEAENMGIEIPRYIKKEAAEQKKIYKNAIFEIDEKGEVTSDIPKPNMDCIKDIESLIHEAKAKERKEKLQNVIESVKGVFSKPDREDGAEPGD